MVTIVIVDLGRHEESRMIVIVDRGRHEELLTVVFVDRGRATKILRKIHNSDPIVIGDRQGPKELMRSWSAIDRSKIQQP